MGGVEECFGLDGRVSVSRLIGIFDLSKTWTLSN